MMNRPHRELATFELPPEPDDDVPILGSVANCEPAPPAFSAPVRLARGDGGAERVVASESWRRDGDDGEHMRLQLVISTMPQCAPTLQIVALGRDGGVRSVVAIAAGDHGAVRDGLEVFNKAVAAWRRERGPRGRKET